MRYARGARNPEALALAHISRAARQAELARLTDPAVAYPDYYLRPFHAYAEGNLNWLCAYEAESATYSMALRVWPQARARVACVLEAFENARASCG